MHNWPSKALLSLGHMAGSIDGESWRGMTEILRGWKIRDHRNIIHEMSKGVARGVSRLPGTLPPPPSKKYIKYCTPPPKPTPRGILSPPHTHTHTLSSSYTHDFGDFRTSTYFFLQTHVIGFPPETVPLEKGSSNTGCFRTNSSWLIATLLLVIFVKWYISQSC